MQRTSLITHKILIHANDGTTLYLAKSLNTSTQFLFLTTKPEHAELFVTKLDAIKTYLAYANRFSGNIKVDVSKHFSLVKEIKRAVINSIDSSSIIY